MIKPTFTKALSLHDEVFSSSDLEEKILAFGLGVLPYGVIDKDSDLLTNCFEDIEYKAIITSLQAFLSKQNPSEPIEIFWSDARVCPTFVFVGKNKQNRKFFKEKS